MQSAKAVDLELPEPQPPKRLDPGPGPRIERFLHWLPWPGQVKIGCWPGWLSLQPATLQSAALAEADTPPSTERPSKAFIIVLMIMLLQALCPLLLHVAKSWQTEPHPHGNVCFTIALVWSVLRKGDPKLGHHNWLGGESSAQRFLTEHWADLIWMQSALAEDSSKRWAAALRMLARWLTVSTLRGVLAGLRTGVAPQLDTEGRYFGRRPGKRWTARSGRRVAHRRVAATRRGWLFLRIDKRGAQFDRCKATQP